MRSSKTEHKTSSVASAVWHVAPSCWNQMLPLQFLWTKIRSTWSDNDRHCNDLSLLIFEEKLPIYASGPKFAPNSDSFWVRRFFNVCVQVFCAPNASILLVNIPATIKMRFIWKDDFFLPKSASSISRSHPHPSVVQVYTQPYSFGGRIKLIISQIRHELSTGWKKR